MKLKDMLNTYILCFSFFLIMPYIYIGEKAIYHGRPLFKILGNLKNMGQGRIVYKNDDYIKHPGQIHFYRILLAQPLMDEKSVEGNVIVEKVFKGIRSVEPVNISAIVSQPDFRLVPKDEESAFCQMDKVRNYDMKKDAPTKPKFIEMSPLLKRVMQRNRKAGNQNDFLLPAHEIYKDDHNLDERVRLHSLAEFIGEQYSTYKDYDVNEHVPDDWNLERVDYPVGRKKWAGFVEGWGWEEQQERDVAEEELKKTREEQQM